MLTCIETRASWLLGVPQNFKHNAMRTLVRLDPLLSVQAISTSFIAAEVYLPLPILDEPDERYWPIRVDVISLFNLKTSESHGDRLASTSLTHVMVFPTVTTKSQLTDYILNSRLQAAPARTSRRKHTKVRIRQHPKHCYNRAYATQY